MKIDSYTFRLMLIFLPGIISLLISYNLIVRKRDDNFTRVLYIFLYSTISYLITEAIYKYCFNDTVSIINEFFSNDPKIELKHITLACVISVIIVFIETFMSYYSVLNHIARFTRCTNRFGDMDLWQFFNSDIISQNQDGWLYVRDHKQKLAYYGSITHYSDSDAERELILYDVTVYDNETGEKLYDVKHLYLSRNKDDLTIEIPKPL